MFNKQTKALCMKKFRIYLFMAALMVPLWALADYSPATVQAALKKMYPTATDVAWTHQENDQGNYYVADFELDGYETDVWFDSQANWVMTLADWESADELSSTVYDAFSMGEYAACQVEDVTQATFPNRQPVVVIKVGEPNVENHYQLFYAPDGTLLRAYDMGYTEGTLCPGTFNFE